MLTVAPIGRTKLEISLSTPSLFSAQSIVTGRVAALELVENPKSCAAAIPLIKKPGLVFVISLTKIPYTKIIIISPIIRVTEYIPSAINKSILGDSTTKVAKSANTPYGALSIIKSISFKIIELKPSKKSLTGFACFGSIKIIPIPKKIAKKITCSIFLLFVAASNIFAGTTSTSGCSGPLSDCSCACSCFCIVSASYS